MVVSRLTAAQLGIFPSAIVFSGNRSPHLYFKLNQLMPCSEIEALNRSLAARLDGDRSVINIDRVMRHPGSVHEKTGKIAEMLSFSAHVIPVDDLLALRGEAATREGLTVGTIPRGLARERSGDWLEAANELGGWHERRDLDLGEPSRWGFTPTAGRQVSLDENRGLSGRVGSRSRTTRECMAEGDSIERHLFTSYVVSHP